MFGHVEKVLFFVFRFFEPDTFSIGQSCKKNGNAITTHIFIIIFDEICSSVRAFNSSLSFRLKFNMVAAAILNFL